MVKNAPYDGDRLPDLLVAIGACRVNFREGFSYTSGGQGPFYADLRVLQAHVRVRELVAQHIAELIRTCSTRIEVVAGIKTGAIPISTLVADILKLPHISINKEAKRGGVGGVIEGMSPRGRDCVVIEDTVNEGLSLDRGVKAIQALRGHVRGCYAILAYHPERVSKRYIPFHALISLEEIFEALFRAKRITKNQLDDLKYWRTNQK